MSIEAPRFSYSAPSTDIFPIDQLLTYNNYYKLFLLYVIKRTKEKEKEIREKK